MTMLATETPYGDTADALSPEQRAEKLRAVHACLVYLIDEVAPLGEPRLERELSEAIRLAQVSLQGIPAARH